MVTRVLPVLVACLSFALLLAVGTQAADDKTHEGIVVKAGDGRLTMTDNDGKNEHSHDVALDAKISCDGKDCKLADLKKGTKVKVTTSKRGDKTVATKIEGKTA